MPDEQAPFEKFYAELSQIAARVMNGERVSHTLEPSALVNEAYLRLFGAENLVGASRSYYLAAAAMAMRRVLVDHARQRISHKRGGGRGRVTLSGVELAGNSSELDVLDVERALLELSEVDKQAAGVVEMRYFGGLKGEDIATKLEISPRQVDKEWEFARGWLRTRLAAYAREPSA